MAYIVEPAKAIDILGGTKMVADMLGLDQRVVLNWRVRGLPPNTYAVLAPLLTVKGCQFPPDLFQQRSVTKKFIKRYLQQEDSR